MSIPNKAIFKNWVEQTPREAANEIIGDIDESIFIDSQGELVDESRNQIFDLLNDFAVEQRRIGREEAQ